MAAEPDEVAQASAAKARTAGDALYLLAAYALTVPSMLVQWHVGPSQDLMAYLKIGCMALFAAHAALLWKGKRTAAAGTVLFVTAVGLTWASLLVLEIYKVVTMMPFNFSVVASVIEDAKRTLVHVLGPHGVLITVGTFLALLAAMSAAAWLLLGLARRQSSRLALGRGTALASLALFCYFVAADVLFVRDALELRMGEQQRLHLITSPDYSHLAIRSTESVFILHLESVNSAAIFERTADGKGHRARIRQPGLETMLKEGGGVFFPFFWANGTQTHLAWESILCGVSGNTGHALSLDPARVQLRTCLPRHLAGAGYATLFLYSYFNLEFFNLGPFLKAIGFQEVAFGDKLMAQGDRRHAWAYDDCVFYERAFEYLAKRGLDKRERVFAYFEVGMNHIPFRNTMKHPQAHPYREPKTELEHYLNSIAEQDHCLATFWRKFREMGRDDVHVFIVPDHSIWVHGVSPENDNLFATWFAYIPPARRAAEFRARDVLQPVPSQAQLYPTILDLLEKAPLAQSFAFALRGEPPPARYENCHLLADPNYRLVVRRGDERAEYRLYGGEVVRPGAAPEAMDFLSFQARFGCRG